MEVKVSDLEENVRIKVMVYLMKAWLQTLKGWFQTHRSEPHQNSCHNIASLLPPSDSWHASNYVALLSLNLYFKRSCHPAWHPTQCLTRSYDHDWTIKCRIQGRSLSAWASDMLLLSSQPCAPCIWNEETADQSKYQLQVRIGKRSNCKQKHSQEFMNKP